MRMPIVVVLGIVALAVSYNQRMLDPLTTVMARDLGVSVGEAIGLSPAFILPYALVQPILGPLADAYGKARVLRLSMLWILITSLASLLATGYWTLFVLRMMAGVGAGGIIPVALALIADRTPIDRRQIALSHFMSVMMVGQLYVAPLSALIAGRYGWMFNFIVASAFAVLSLVMLLKLVKPNPDAVRQPFSIRRAIDTYRSILALPVARVCFIAVFIEGICIFGLVPNIAPYLEERGLGSAVEAGYILASMAVGGMIYVALVSFLAARFSMTTMMGAGVVIAALGVAGLALSPSWTLMLLAYALIGFGFYMLHSGLQARVTEVLPGSRASTVSLHAFFMFIGIALGPVLFTWLWTHIGARPTLLLDAAVLMIVLAAVRFLAARP